MASPPEVSVVIPTRDRWSRLGPTLTGALRQHDVDVEVIVVDDGSGETAPADVPGLADPRVRVLRHERNRGVAAARNSGIEAARGGWLAFLDDDDYWSPAKLRTQLDAAAARDAVLAYGAAAVLNDEGDLIETYSAPDPDEILPLLVPGNSIPAGASNVIARTSLVRSLGGFDEALFQLTGWDLWIRLADAGPAAACEGVVLAYVQHSSAMLLTDTRENLIAEFEYLARKHQELSARIGVQFDRAGLEMWMAWGDSRSGRRVKAARGYLRAARMYAGGGRRHAVSRRYAVKANLKQSLSALRGQPVTDSGRRLAPAPSSGAEPAWLELYRR